MGTEAVENSDIQPTEGSIADNEKPTPKDVRCMEMLARRDPWLKICKTLSVHPAYVKRIKTKYCNNAKISKTQIRKVLFKNWKIFSDYFND